MVSTRADIFGRVFADDLGRLKDQLSPFPTEVARAVVAASLDVPVDALFATFDEPIAAASLAQAHPATLADGRRVAVKVLRPGIDRRVARDIETLALAAAWIEAAIPLSRRLEPQALAATVSRALLLELDLRMEAAGASELADIMAEDGYMRAPAVVWAGVGRRVLTLDWAEGMALSDPASLEQPGLDRPALATNLMRAFLAQAMDHGVFHADLHEGNLFIAAPDKVMAVDFGIIGRLDAVARRHLAEILWGFLQRDYHRVAKAHFDAGYVPAHHSIDAFAQALRAVGEPNVGKPAYEVSMGRTPGPAVRDHLAVRHASAARNWCSCRRPWSRSRAWRAAGSTRKHDRWDAAEPIVRRWITPRTVACCANARTERRRDPRA